MQSFYTDRILLSDCSLKYPFKFFFLRLFLKSLNLILIFNTIAVFILIKQFVLKIYYSFSQKNILLF